MKHWKDEVSRFGNEQLIQCEFFLNVTIDVTLLINGCPRFEPGNKNQIEESAVLCISQYSVSTPWN